MVVDMVVLRKQRGFTYLIALFMVATLSIITLRALENSLTKDRRAKEEQLLFVGQAFQNAIMVYYQDAGTYPTSLDVLLNNDKTSTLHRPLRRLYFDPITGSQSWGTVTNTSGAITGVYSTSNQQPIKVNGFPTNLSNFVGATSYQQWRFTYPANPPTQTTQTN